MVFYECIITARNTANFSELSAVAKNIAHKVVEHKGIVRAVHNHGIRLLHDRIRASEPDLITGEHYYQKARMFSVYYDANPTALRHIEVHLHLDPTVLRYNHVRARSKVDLVLAEQPDKNQIVKGMRRRDEKERQKLEAEDQAISTATESEDIIELMIENMKDD